MHRNDTFAQERKSEFVNRPVLHIVLVDLWSTGLLANSDILFVEAVYII